MKRPPLIPTWMTGFTRVGFRTEAGRASELAAQYEELLDQVWKCERVWEFDNRIRLAHPAPRRRWGLRG